MSISEIYAAIEIDRLHGELEKKQVELEVWKNAYLALQKAYAKLEDRLARINNISGEGQ